MDAVAPARHRLVTWHDPADLRRRAQGLTGLDVLHRFASGLLPAPPVAELVGFEPTFVSPGLVVFAYEPREEHYNPLGTVHGGIVATVLDTAMGCAVQSELDAGVGYTTIELKTNFVRPVTLASGRLRAEGRLVHGGSRIVTAEARLADGEGKLYAHATSTCLVVRDAAEAVRTIAA